MAKRMRAVEEAEAKAQLSEPELPVEPELASAYKEIDDYVKEHKNES
jgi:beta-galactosidase GanA